MVTGGVEPNKESFASWFGAGVTAVGMGSQLFRKEWLDSGNYEAVSAICNECMQLVKS